VGINELKLKRGFHAVFGTTAFGYLRARRLEAARALLLAKSVSVGEAAERVGYKCPSRFASAFRRHFGRSPSSLRQQSIHAR
jgi:AraC-like DNA-binding protein